MALRPGAPVGPPDCGLAEYFHSKTRRRSAELGTDVFPDGGEPSVGNELCEIKPYGLGMQRLNGTMACSDEGRKPNAIGYVIA